ncbi:LAME_0H11562g1_1 [Lachancea meyersii CBS 8951]|uniref:LAME_0H11562g1_1 n=1 Tax=Lachancea meyersii CBS 8951 TaxID=1266667 RepID=A0A1G4KGE1_9SACH|nr:LAME_0H11562g1_1 [Lachancea meyersii CBS 8951]
MLPRIHTLLQQRDAVYQRSMSEPCSPSLRPLPPIKSGSFTSNARGIITLPPLQLTPLQPATQVPATPRSSVKRTKSCYAALENSPAPQRVATPSSLAKTPQPDSQKAFAFISHSQETFPSKEPAIDNAPLARRKRRRTSKHELGILQSEFERCPTPDKQKRLYLSEVCSMSEKAIQIWFQNKRQSVKRHQKIGSYVEGSGHTTEGDDSAESHSPIVANSLTPVSVKRSTPCALWNPKTPPLAILDTGSIALDTVAPTSDITPTKQSGYNTHQSKRGQALTFRLKTDNKTLTPIKTSPNNRVNKLINGDSKLSPTRQTKGASHRLDTAPLRSLDINAIRH